MYKVVGAAATVTSYSSRGPMGCDIVWDTEIRIRQTSPCRVMHRGGVGFGWMDSTSVVPLVHDVPLRWSRVSPRVVVRLFHHAKDDLPPAKVPGAPRSNLRRHDVQPMLPCSRHPSLKIYHKSCPPPASSVETTFPPRPSTSSPTLSRLRTGIGI